MWRLSLLLTLAVALPAAGFIAGWRIHDWRDAAGAARVESTVVAKVARQATVSQTVAVAAQAGQDHVRNLTHTLIERVPTYVSPATDREYPLPLGFVRLHDAAAAGVDLPAASEGPGDPDDAPSPVTASDAAAIIVTNYGVCHADQSRLAALQAWARGQGLSP
ncbi:MAG TPA: hypothetical protein VMU37_01120 [Caulobacteraceae bacterium]|nr:hypothetical protein [Caulobacteraceae bacterium]